MENRIPRWLGPSILLAAILALVSISLRYSVEARNKAATMALEIETVESLALGQGKPIDAALVQLKAQGLGALVLTEETVGDLANAHRVDFKPGPIMTGSPATLDTVMRAIQRRFPASNAKLTADGIDLSAPGAPTIFNLRMMSVGLDEQEVATARRGGLRIIGRFGNPMGSTDHYVESTLEEAHRQGADIFLPVGDQVLGRRDSTPKLIETLHRLKMYYASPEFAKLGGDENVVQDAPELVIRLHSAQAAELDKLPPAEAVDRYARAARERNQRILLLRPANFSSAAPVKDMDIFMKAINREVERQGGAIGPAKPFEDSSVPTPLFSLIGLALAPAIWFSVAYFVRSKPCRLAGAILVGMLGVACFSLHARPVMAFLAAVAFPIVAFQVLEARKGRSWLIEYLLVSGISFVGGLGVAGLMNGLPYFVRAEQFEGVKVAVFLPILVVAYMLYSRLSNLRSSMGTPISWASMVLTLVLLGVMAFMISRTGNDNPAGVSGIELKLRSFLDMLLFVRPRTKEFLVGHPLLIVGIAMLIRQRAGQWIPKGFAGWTVLALTLGAVGQTDIVNTMCHFHTPVMLSFERILVGLAAGGILGAVLWYLVAALLPKEPVAAVKSEALEPEPERSQIAH